jgi:NitT/TauT family transport system permease protein
MNTNVTERSVVAGIAAVPEHRPVPGPPATPAAAVSKPMAEGRIELMCSVGLALALFGLAEVSARLKWVSPMILPRPSDVAKVLYQGLGDGFFLMNVLSSLGSLVSGFVVAFMAAIVLAGLISSSRFAERVLSPYIVAFQSLPKVAIAPLVVLWLGFGELSKVTIVAIVCFFPIMVNTVQGLKVRDRDHDELLRSLGASRWQHFRLMRLPHAIPYIFAGVHIGAIFALIGVVVAEFVGTNAGIGFALLQAKAQFDVPGVYACLVVLMLMGLALSAATSFVERRVARWMGEAAVVHTP